MPESCLACEPRRARAGHTVDGVLRVCAKCITAKEEEAKRRIAPGVPGI